MESFDPILEWIDSQSAGMLNLLNELVAINSYSLNLAGLKKTVEKLQKEMTVFNEGIEMIDLAPMEVIDSQGRIISKPLGQALRLQKRPQAGKKALLMIHMDTVFPLGQPEIDPTSGDANMLKGPGVADAKGGIVVMLKALEALERSELAQHIGWTVLINPDEELGSPGSRRIMESMASEYHIGLIFEPCLANGDLVGARKGSGNFVLVVRGRSAHAGRDHHLGINAVNALAEAISCINALNGTRPGLTVNMGMIEGGLAVNVVPDIAIGRFNIRIEKQEDEAHVWFDLKEIIKNLSNNEGIELELHGGFFAPPKALQGKTVELFQQIKSCGSMLGMDLQWQASGGVCDGNRLAAFGLPNIDTLGVRGGGLHSAGEYLHIDSLTERAKLTALFLLRWATGDFPALDQKN